MHLYTNLVVLGTFKPFSRSLLAEFHKSCLNKCLNFITATWANLDVHFDYQYNENMSIESSAEFEAFQEKLCKEVRELIG